MKNAGKPSFAMGGKKKELPPYLYNNGMMRKDLIVTSIEKNHRKWQNLSHLLDNVILVHLHMCNY